MNHDNRFNDELLNHFLNKRSPEFWKCWASKTRSNFVKEVFINDSNDEVNVANAFADHFQSVYYDSSTNRGAKLEFEQMMANLAPACSASRISSLFTVELVDKCIRKLKLGKASGPDELSAEHLLNAHPIVVVHLCLLFRDMALHSYVPDELGKGTIIPLIKDKLGNINDINNYRGITLISVISELFELVLLELRAPYLTTHDLQFGFKKGMGCNNAIFVFQETIILSLGVVPNFEHP
jgi:hypothetical protein